jgi:hypothetical protein
LMKKLCNFSGNLLNASLAVNDIVFGVTGILQRNVNKSTISHEFSPQESRKIWSYLSLGCMQDMGIRSLTSEENSWDFVATWWFELGNEQRRSTVVKLERKNKENRSKRRYFRSVWQQSMERLRPFRIAPNKCLQRLKHTQDVVWSRHSRTTARYICLFWRIMNNLVIMANEWMENKY